MSQLLALFRKAVRAVLGAAALVVIGLSFARVLTRELAADTDEEGVELVVLHWSGEGGQEEDAIVQGALSRFAATHPGVRVRRINPGDAASFYTKLQTMMAAGEPPDVFYLGDERAAAFAKEGVVLPVDDFLIEDRLEPPHDPVVLDDFYPVTVDAFRFDGERTGNGPLYGIPKDFTTIGFYYNVDLFEQAGLEPPPDDWTWDDFASAARAIATLPGCTGAEFVTWPKMLRLYLRTEGGDVIGDDPDELTLHDPRVMAALERLRSWRHDEDRTLTSGKSKIAEGQTVFVTGKVGMAGPFGRWVVPGYRKIEGFRWDFAPMPRGRENVNAIATVAWAISSRTEHPREAWNLVRALVSPAAQERFSRLGLAIPTLRSVAESDAFIDPARPPSRDRSYLAAAEVAEVIGWPANHKFEPLLRTRLDQALKTGDVPLVQAVANFERDWTLELQSPLARGDFEPMPFGRFTTSGVAALLALLAIGWLVALGWRPGELMASEERTGWMMASPLILGLALFTAFPVGLSFLLSFARWSGVTTLEEAQYVGLANYRQLLFHDERFATSVRVTLYYALLAVPLGQLFALGAALLMNAKLRFIGLFRAAWYLPSVLAGVGVAVLWRWVFDGDHGLLNALLAPALAPFGLSPPDWFGVDAAGWGPPAFALLSLWMVGGSMMIYLAGLKGIPRELYEAAEMDGSSGFERFRHVTLPMLGPVILFNVVMAVIASFQVFTQALVMTGGEPGDLTRFYVLYLYNQAFEFYEMGYASAMAWILLVIVLALTLVVMRGSKGLVHYEALEG